MSFRSPFQILSYFTRSCKSRSPQRVSYKKSIKTPLPKQKSYSTIPTSLKGEPPPCHYQQPISYLQLVNKKVEKLNWFTTESLNTNINGVPPALQSVQTYATHTFNIEGRKKVREMYECDKQPEKPKRLAFRQTSKTDCEFCLDTIKGPIKCPPLGNPKRLYDPMKMKWNHECPPLDPCDIGPPRMDDVMGCKVEQKKLPKLPDHDDCNMCITVPSKCPPLCPPKKKYDPCKMKYEHTCPPPEMCNIDPPRMDNVVGLKVEPKRLPKLPVLDDCRICIMNPTKCPPLRLPKKKYDQCEMKWKHYCPPTDICDIDPPRMDNVVGLKIERKKLPKLLLSDDCKKCITAPSKAPPLQRPKLLYNPHKLKWKHECPRTDLCDVDPPRMDNVLGVKVEKKVLPQLPEIDDCKPCQSPPKKCPPLNRPKRVYDPCKQKWKHTCPPVDICNVDPPRMDDVLGLKVLPKVLPKLPEIDECMPCFEGPTTCPPLCPPTRLYDPCTMKWDHKCPPLDPCEVAPPRMDIVVGLKVEPKKLPKLPVQDDCKQCIISTSTAPPLCPPKMLYNPMEMKWNHDCPPPNPCDVAPPRMDEVKGLKIEKKKLPKLTDTDECKKCINTPFKCPPLRRLKLSYDPLELKWNHTCSTEDQCDVDPPRMDNVVGLSIKKKKLPKLPAIDDCKPCFVNPRKCPPLNRPKLNYDPSKMKYKHVCPPEDICDVEPPRMDDVRCWRPRKKILPSF